MTTTIKFPNNPPIVLFINNAGQRVNPNLKAEFNKGEVCLSILGTWSGEPGESWNSNTSSFLQIVNSIQALILVEEPYYNEPGYEKFLKSVNGKINSDKYNLLVYQYTIDHMMIDLLEKNEFPEFSEIIQKYFKYQKNNILITIEKWYVIVNTPKFLSSKEKLSRLLLNL